jgi:hypothetical protein
MLNLIRNLTPAQIVILVISTAGVINGSAAQLAEWFGPKVAHNIITAIGFGQTLIGAWAVALTGQGSAIKQVLAMPGVDKITVNSQANSTLAAIAVDPALDKIAPLPVDKTAVEATAKAG